MKARFTFSRQVTLSGFVADADPNVTPPAAALIATIGEYTDSRHPSSGHALVGAFNTSEANGTCVFRTWFREDSTSEWFILGDDTLTHRKRQVTQDLRGGDIFVQLLSFGTTGAAATFKVYVMEF